MICRKTKGKREEKIGENMDDRMAWKFTRLRGEEGERERKGRR